MPGLGGFRRLELLTLFFVFAVGNFSLKRIIGELDLGLFGELRYWIFGLLVLMVLSDLVLRDFVIVCPRRILYWVLSVALLHVYVLISQIWAPAPVTTVVLADVLLLLLLLITSLFVVSEAAERSMELFLRSSFWVSAVLGILALLSWYSQQDLWEFGIGGIGLARLNGTAIVGSIYIWQKTREKLWLLPIPVFLLSMLLSGSRASVLALAVTLVLLIFPGLIRARKKLRVFQLVAVFSVWIVILISPPARAIQEYFSSTIWNPGAAIVGVQSVYLAERGRLFSDAWKIFLQSPVGGVGFGGYFSLTGEFYPHNLILLVAVDAGIIGIFLLLLTFSPLVAKLHVRKLGSRTALSIAIFHLVTNMFLGTYYDARFMWLFFVFYLLLRGDTRIAAARRRTYIDKRSSQLQA